MVSYKTEQYYHSSKTVKVQSVEEMSFQSRFKAGKRAAVPDWSPVSIQTHTTHAGALRKEKYASKMKSAQEMQQIKENYASKKQK